MQSCGWLRKGEIDKGRLRVASPEIQGGRLMNG